MNTIELRALPPGTQLVSPNGVYKVESILGAGGFGITYRVVSTIRYMNIDVEARFAVKEMFPSDVCERDSTSGRMIYSSPVKNRVQQSLSDFLSEARRLQSVGVKHPNIVKINEVFEANGTAYYVMEYLPGKSLAQYVEENGPMSESDVRSMLAPIADALTVLHENRVTHLDIKPHNIMLTPDKESGVLRPVLIDFGLSKHYDHEGKATSTRLPGGYSEGFSPAEQYGGISTFSPQADVYALAATFLYCLTGNVPPGALTLMDETVDKLIPDKVSSGMRMALRHAMAHNPAKRIQSVSEFIVDSSLDDVEIHETEIPIGVAPSIISSIPPVPPSVSDESMSDDDNNMSEMESDNDEKAAWKSWWSYLIVGIIITFLIFVYFQHRADMSSLDDNNIVEEVAVDDVDQLSPMMLHYSGAFPEGIFPVIEMGGEAWITSDTISSVPFNYLGVAICNPDPFMVYPRNADGYYTWDSAVHVFGELLPSKSQAEIIVANLDMLNEQLRIIGADPLENRWFWTSTPMNDNNAWGYSSVKSTVTWHAKSDATYVRPVSPVTLIKR